MSIYGYITYIHKIIIILYYYLRHSRSGRSMSKKNGVQMPKSKRASLSKARNFHINGHCDEVVFEQLHHQLVKWSIVSYYGGYLSRTKFHLVFGTRYAVSLTRVKKMVAGQNQGEACRMLSRDHVWPTWVALVGYTPVDQWVSNGGPKVNPYAKGEKKMSKECQIHAASSTVTVSEITVTEPASRQASPNKNNLEPRSSK